MFAVGPRAWRPSYQHCAWFIDRIAVSTRASKSLLVRNTSSKPFPQTLTCPPPTCTCREMPTGLDIDKKQPLAGTMAAYHEQVVLCTGHSKWPSKIEDDDGMPLVQGLKKLLGGRGKFFNPFHNVLVTASSLANPSAESSIALLFPSFIRVSLPGSLSVSSSHIQDFLKGYVLTKELDWKLPTPPPNPHELVRDLSLSSAFPSQTINDVVILICGHGARDERCGIMAPLLDGEFNDKLTASGYEVDSTASEVSASGRKRALLGAISHIGGHKYAGNIIVYIPPSLEKHPLAGCGVWYGRVEPKHVEGIVQKTVNEGVIIHDLFRGGIDLSRRPIYL